MKTSAPNPATSSEILHGPVHLLVDRLRAVRSQAAMLSMLEAEPRIDVTKAVAAEIKAQVAILQDHIRSDRATQAIATVLAMLFVDANHAISCMRREGVLRASRFGFKGSLIGRVAKAGLSIKHLTNASADRVVYLGSVAALTRLAPNVLTLNEEMVRTIRSRKAVVLKTVLVAVNSVLYHGWLNDPDAGSLDGRFYSVEEYAEAASLILATYTSIFDIEDTCCDRVDASALDANALVYDRLLLAAIRITRFKDAEFTIDGLPYQAELSGETVTISSIDPALERSVRLGYIQRQGQAMIRFTHLKEASPGISIKDFIQLGFDAGALQHLTRIVDKPFRRIRAELPGVSQFFDMFSRDELFRDELEKLLVLDVDNFAEFDDLILDITERVTSLDVFKVQRFFHFLSALYQRRLEEIEDHEERRQLTLTSTVFVIRHEDLLSQMMLIFDDEAKCRDIVALFTMNPADPHLDLQYRPFVNLGRFFVIAPHVVAASNLVRNTIVANRLRTAAIGSNDRMVQSVGDALRKARFRLESDFEVKIAGRKLEIDIVAWRDGCLFIFECKNAYHPCSAHEMRNSWDHIRTARKQLDVRRELLKDSVNQKQLFAKLGWDVATGADVHTAIVIANRVFHGATLNGHPVRQAHELINVLTSGRIVSPEDSLSFWLGQEFQTADLIAYLTGDSIATNQLTSLDPHTWSYSMGYRQLDFATYVLDPVRYDREARERYGPAIPGGRAALALEKGSSRDAGSEAAGAAVPPTGGYEDPVG